MNREEVIKAINELRETGDSKVVDWMENSDCLLNGKSNAEQEVWLKVTWDEKHGTEYWLGTLKPGADEALASYLVQPCALEGERIMAEVDKQIVLA